jgi:hypothetical protein
MIDADSLGGFAVLAQPAVVDLAAGRSLVGHRSAVPGARPLPTIDHHDAFRLWTGLWITAAPEVTRAARLSTCMVGTLVR